MRPCRCKPAHAVCATCGQLRPVSAMRVAGDFDGRKVYACQGACPRTVTHDNG